MFQRNQLYKREIIDRSLWGINLLKYNFKNLTSLMNGDTFHNFKNLTASVVPLKIL